MEAVLGGSIPDDLLAYWLAVGERVDELVALTRYIDGYYEGMEERAWRTKLGFAHVAFDETDEPSEGVLCARLGQAPARIELWKLRKGEGWRPKFLREADAADAREDDLVTFCRWKHGTASKAPVDFEAAVTPAEVSALVPTIVAESPEAKRRVRHAKFGEGIVLRTLPPDKLEIDFGPAGVKKLLAATVADV